MITETIYLKPNAIKPNSNLKFYYNQHKLRL